MTDSPPRHTGLAISAWAATSPYGHGRDDFVRGVRAGHRAIAPLDPDAWAVPFTEAAVVPDFTARDVLGRKGTRSMDRPTALAVATVGTLLSGAAADTPPADDVALVLGTSNGSVQSMMDFTRDSLTQAKPYHVDPARFPNTVMNCAAGQCAIWHGLRGPNTTLAGGRATALLALNYARRLWRSGRAGKVLCGAVEEFSEQRARLEALTAAPGTAATLGEGCAMFALEPLDAVTARGDRPHAELLTLEFGVFGAADDSADLLAALVDRAISAARLDPAGIGLVAPSAAADPLRACERTAIGKALPGCEPRWVDVAPLLGDAGAASGTFQLAAVLALAGTVPATRHALITSIDPDGVAGCAVLRLPAGPMDHHTPITER